jgi:hypothetical protein
MSFHPPHPVRRALMKATTARTLSSSRITFRVSRCRLTTRWETSVALTGRNDSRGINPHPAINATEIAVVTVTRVLGTGIKE